MSARFWVRLTMLLAVGAALGTWPARGEEIEALALDYPEEMRPLAEGDASGPEAARATGEFVRPYDAPYHEPPCCCGGCGPEYFLAGRAGLDYFDVPGESQAGGLYGADFGRYLFGSGWGFLGTMNVSHIAGGEQFAGAAGLAKVPDPCGLKWSSPYSALIMFDHFSDSRVADFHVDRLRLQFGYAVNACLEVGAIYTEPLGSDDDVPFGFGLLGELKQSQNLATYVAGRSGVAQWSAEVGYHEPLDSALLGCSLQAPVASNVFAFAGANYETEEGNWWLGLTLEFRLGSGRCGSSCCAPSCVAASRPPAVSGGAGGIALAGYVPPEDTTPQRPTTPEFPLRELNPQGGATGEPALRRPVAALLGQYAFGLLMQRWAGYQLHQQYTRPGHMWQMLDVEEVDDPFLPPDFDLRIDGTDRIVPRRNQ